MSIVHRLARTAAALCLSFSATAGAQDYPNRPIRFIVPQPPSGPSDIMARALGERLAVRLGQPVLIENRPGAASNIGTELAAKAPKDGYTISLATIQHVVNRFLFPSLPFDPDRDLMPVTLLGKSQLHIVVAPNAPFRSVAELIAWAKANPGKLAWGSAGNGGASHLALELFKARTGIEATHVPYKGNRPALNDLLGDQIPVIFDGIVTSAPLVKAGRIKSIMVADSVRSPLLPDTPTSSEVGLPGFEAAGPLGLLAPGGSPPAAIARLQREIAFVLQQQDFRQSLIDSGIVPIGSTSAEFGDYLKAEAVKWEKIIRESKIKPE